MSDYDELIEPKKYFRAISAQTEIPATLSEMFKHEPEWVMSRFRYMEKQAKELQARVDNLNAVLESALNGLDWYRAEHPEDESPVDDELRDEIRRIRDEK